MTTIQDINQLAEKIATLRAKEAEASLVKKEITTELEATEKQMIETLIANDMQSYKSPHGTCSLSFRTSVKIPRTAEDREAFFSYLKSKGLYDTMIGVNSQTLNSFYKSEIEAAKERGDADFNVPGISEISVNQILSFRK